MRGSWVQWEPYSHHLSLCWAQSLKIEKCKSLVKLGPYKAYALQSENFFRLQSTMRRFCLLQTHDLGVKPLK